MTLRLEQLRVFAAVAERRHMTRAAEALHMTQSAASAAIAALEARTGVRLFDRVGRGLALSAEGAAFLPSAKAVLAQAALAERALDDLAGLRHGAITIAASQTVGHYWLPLHMARFAAAYPAIRLHLESGNTAQVAHAVQEGRADLGFGEGEIDQPALIRRRIATDRIALYTAPDHALRHGTLTPDALGAAAWALREPGSGTRSEFEHAIAAHGVSPATLRVALELPSNEALLCAVMAGALVTAVSELAAQPLVQAGRVAMLDLDLGTRGFDVITHAERRLSHAAAAFLHQIDGAAS